MTQPAESLPAKLFAAISGQFGIFVLATIVQVILARSLGPSGKGLFALTTLAITTMVMLAHGSLSAANSHFTGRIADERHLLVGNSLFIGFVWGAIISGVYLLLILKFRLDFFPEISDRLWGMAITAIIPLLLLELFNGVIIGLNWIKRFNLTLLAREVLILGGIVYLVRLGKLSVETGIGIWVSAIVIVAVFQVGSAWMKVDRGISISPSLFGQMAFFSLKSHVANVFSFLKLRFDWFLVGYFLSSTDVGIYSVAVQMTSILWYVPTAISQILVPHISWRDDQAGNKLTPRLCRIGFTSGLTGAILLLLFGNLVIITVFGTAFRHAYPALVCLLPGAILFALGRILAGDLFGRGKPEFAMIISILTFVFNFGVNLLFIPRFGIIGAAIASSITHGITGLLFLYFFLRESHVSVADVFIMKREDWDLIFGKKNQIFK